MKASKYFFWLILGGLSTYFGEVITASTPFPFFTLSGLLVTYPFYTLNILVFSYIAFRKRKVDLYTLFLTGQLFGLFEFYGTKMLWNPGWGAEPKLLGISLIPFLLLIFLWHPLMSFTLPIIIAEGHLTSSRETLSGFPEWLSKVLKDRRISYGFLILFILFCGINQAVNSPSKRVSLLSPSFSWIVLLFSMWVWKRKTQQVELRELLPTKREMIFLLPLFILMYSLLTVHLFPEGIPPLKDQVGAWMAYLILGILVYLEVKSPEVEFSTPVFKMSWFQLNIFGFAVAFVAYLMPKSVPLVVAAWIPGVLLGIAIFCGAVLRIAKGVGIEV